MGNLIVDSHIHTARCGHAVGDVDEYVSAAAQKGVGVISFTEHVPLPHDLDAAREYSMAPEQWPAYLSEVREQDNPSVKVLLGVEADWLPGRMDHVGSFLEGAEYDVVLGSVHMLEGWVFDDPDKIDSWDSRNVDEVWTQYFSTLADAASSGLFDVMAHPDLVKKFCHYPSSDPESLFDEIARICARAGVAIEVSTGGLRKPCAELYPSDALLAAFGRHGVPATTGSDAHAPGEVGYRMDLAEDALRRAGYTSKVYFEGRSAVEVAL